MTLQDIATDIIRHCGCTPCKPYVADDCVMVISAETVPNTYGASKAMVDFSNGRVFINDGRDTHCAFYRAQES